MVITDPHRPFDLSFFAGAGYSLVGQDKGAGGLVGEAGAKMQFFIQPGFSIDLFGRGMYLRWDSFYQDYNNRSQPGNTLPLASGFYGNFFTVGIGFSLRT